MNSDILGIPWMKYKKLKEDRPELFVDNGPIHIENSEEIVKKYVRKNKCNIGVVYESSYNMLLVDLVYEKKGEYFTYERVIPTVMGAAVVGLPIYNGKIILMKQYRHAIRDYQYAVPRGFGEKDISVEDNVKKELYEEIGAKLGNIIYLGNVVADSGLSGGSAAVYVCDVIDYDKNRKDEGVVDIIEIDMEELKIWIAEGKITDGFTLAALSAYSAIK